MTRIYLLQIGRLVGRLGRDVPTTTYRERMDDRQIDRIGYQGEDHTHSHRLLGHDIQSQPCSWCIGGLSFSVVQYLALGSKEREKTGKTVDALSIISLGRLERERIRLAVRPPFYKLIWGRDQLYPDLIIAFTLGRRWSVSCYQLHLLQSQESRCWARSSTQGF